MSFSSSKPTTRKHHHDPTRTSVGPRRSRSVSAYPRTNLDIPSEFANTRDNPLYWADGPDESESGPIEGVSSNFDYSNGRVDGGGGGATSRGRSATRNSGCFGGGGRSLSTVGVDRPRWRSPSQGLPRWNYEHERKQGSGSNFRSTGKTATNKNQRLRDGKNTLVRSASDISEVLKGSNTWSNQHPAFETSDDSTVTLSERDQESRTLSNLRSNEIVLNRNQSLLHGKSKLVRSSSDLSEVLIGYSTWSSQHPVLETEDDSAVSSTCNSETSTRPSILEVEERTLKPVSEQIKVIHWEDTDGAEGAILETVRTEVRRAISDIHKDLKDAILRSDSDIISGSIYSNIAPEASNANTVELVSDFREEFTRELEECEERTRKLRAELAVEEHRELELNQILSDMIPEPETPQLLKPCSIRKGSAVRRTMSKCLEEEAMAYFDECVSISSFDDSDFSSLEDPPSRKATVSKPGDVSGGANRKNIALSLETQDFIHHTPLILSNKVPNLSTSGISNDSGRRLQFSFTSTPSVSLSREQGIQNYLKNFSNDKDQETMTSSVLRPVPRKSEMYDTEMPVEKYLLDKMMFRSRIESGGMLLCGGGISYM
ncbi:hypothetical protein vseg_000889 [Gypsophila vaccaria]